MILKRIQNSKVIKVRGQRLLLENNYKRLRSSETAVGEKPTISCEN